MRNTTTDIFSCDHAHSVITSLSSPPLSAPRNMYLSSMGGKTRFSRMAHTMAMTTRMMPIFQNDEPVFLFTAHSMGSAWHSAIMSASMVASLMVSGIDIMAAMPA